MLVENGLQNESEGLLQEKIDILMVDDHEENLIVLEAVLKSPFYNLINASSGREALKYLLEKIPALILMDVQMPGMDGFETADLIKRNEKTQSVPIIFITAINKDDRYVYEGYSKGAVDYIFKPLDPQILRSKVAVFVDLYRKNRQILKQEFLLREAQRREAQQKMALLQFNALQTENALQKRYLDLAEGVRHGVVWSADTNLESFQFFGKSAEKILGISLEQWSLDKGAWFKHLHQDDHCLFWTALEELTLQQKSEVAFEHRFIRPNGRTIWLHTGMRLGSAVNDPQKTEVRALSVDISKIKEAEAILRKNKDRSDFLVRASLSISHYLDEDMILIQMGQLITPKLADWFFVGIFGEREDLKTWKIFHDDDKKRSWGERLLNRVLLKSLRTPSSSKATSPFRGREQRLQVVPAASEDRRNRFHDRGKIYPSLKRNFLAESGLGPAFKSILAKFQLSSAMMIPLVSGGKQKGIMVHFLSGAHQRFHREDLYLARELGQRAMSALDRAQLFQKAKAAINARDEFISIASHELKTPLTSISLHNQMIMRSIKNKEAGGGKGFPEKSEKMFQVTHRQLGKLAKLVDDLLDISQIHKGKLELRPEKFNLVDLMKDVLDRFGDQCLQNNCRLEFESQELVEGVWDRSRIEQVITNLLTNAIKYGQGHPIHVSLGPDGEKVRITVKDHGIGLAKEHQEKIFQRFERIHSPSHVSGLGLGLYIVSQVVDAHQGKISVESELEKGSSFIVELPLFPSVGISASVN